MKIELGKKEFTLKYNNKALFKIEEILDIPLFELWENEKELKKMKAVYAVVYAGIQEKITFDEFTEVADFKELELLLPKITEVIVGSFNTGSKKK